MSVNNNDDAKTCELEDQFILRLPPKQARVVRKILQKKPKKLKKHVSIQLDNDLRHGVVKVHRKFLHAKLFDLPTIIESNKTIDKVHFFKAADVCQILICQENQFADEEEFAGVKRVGGKTYLSPHGYTPPLKNVRKFRFRKTLHNQEDAEETADIEKEVLWLLRMDNEAVSTKFEFIYDDKLNNSDAVQAEEVNELSIFGEKLSDLESSDEKSASESASSCEINDIMDFTN